MKLDPIKDVVDGIVKGWKRESTSFTQDEILKVWEKAAGKRLAGHSRPVSFKTKRLIVNVDSSPWLYELTLQRPKILTRLKKSFKKKPVTELQFRIGEI